MIKRSTLLRKKDDLSDADFRAHWAVPHAAIAKGFPGLCRYNQNRVDAQIWQIGGGYDAHGLVELWFDGEASVKAAAASPVTAALIEDEPRFLSALTALSIGPAWITASAAAHKLMLYAKVDAPNEVGAALSAVLRELPADLRPSDFAVEPLTFGFRRAGLLAEENPPNLLVILWLEADGAGISDHGALKALHGALEGQAEVASLYLVDELSIV